jgi:septum formation protein
MMLKDIQLVLGSSSASRKMVLSKLGVPFVTLSPDIDESVLTGEQPAEHVTRLSIEKAKRVAEMIAQDSEYDLSKKTYWIIGSDQVAFLNGHPVSKPDSHEDAVAQLLESSGKAITFYTGLCLLNANDGNYLTSVDTTTTHYRPFTLDQIHAYLAHEKPYHCAGSLKSEGLGIALIKKIDSKDPNTLIGLPLIDLCSLMQRVGISLFDG